MARRKIPLRLLAMCSLLMLMLAVSMMVPAIHAERDEEDQLQVPEKEDLKYPNLGSRLSDLAVRVEDGEASAEAAAEEAAIHLEESVAVTIHLTGNVDEVAEFLAISGGDPRNVGEDYIEAYVPVSLLGELSQQPGVLRVREIIPPEAEYGPITSQGVQVHGSAAWNQAGYGGQDIKVGIIDVGFDGLRNLMGKELPTTVVARCYTDIGQFTSNFSDCEKDGVHGTAVAESLMDIAPEVSLYIANPISWADLQAAAEWMLSEGVTVINHSVLRPFDGPGDGTSPTSHSPTNTVNRVVDGGVVWVNAAGNEARETWFSDSPAMYTSSISGVDFVAFDGADDITNGLRGLGRSVNIQLRWDDRWHGASSDLDLRLFDYTLQRYVAGSEDHQTGGSGHIPFEMLDHQLVYDRLYGIVVIHRSGSVPDWIQANIFSGNVRYGRIEYYTEEGSIGSPAEGKNAGMLAVGAAHYWDTFAVADYSSRGPTPDGRPKPDIVGADCGETASYEQFSLDGHGCWFSGTSQASPHVAGLAALVRQRFPDYTPEQTAAYLKDHTEPRGTVPNNTWGYGFAQLPTRDAVASRAPDAPVIRSVAPGQQSLAVAWEAPSTDGGEAITAYDLRHIRSDATDRADANWTVVASAWASGSLEYIITGLEHDAQYDVQVRAVNSVGPGPWSDTASGTTDPAPNLPPVFSATRIIAENSPAGTPAGVPVAATDPEGGPLTYSLTGADAASFNVDESSGQITLAQGATLDYETKASYVVTLTAADSGGASDTIVVTINLTDVDEAPAPPADPCVEQLSGDDTVSGQWAAGCDSEVSGRGHARYYRFTLAQESDVTITLERTSGDADTYLYLRDGEARSGPFRYENDDDGGTSKSTIQADGLPTGTYTVEATTYAPGQTGSFNLTISGLGTAAPPPGPTPADPCQLTNGSSDDGGDKFVGVWDAGCESQTPAPGSGSGPRFARFLTIEVPESEVAWSFILESDDADTYLYLREGFARSGTSLYENDDAEPGNSARSRIREILAAGTYTIEATTYDAGETGSFTLTIS